MAASSKGSKAFGYGGGETARGLVMTAIWQERLFLGRDDMMGVWGLRRDRALIPGELPIDQQAPEIVLCTVA